MTAMWWTLPKVWAILAISLFMGSCSINDSSSRESSGCPCAEAKPFRSTTSNRPVAILLAFDAAGHSRHSQLDPVLLTDTSQSAESWEVPVRKGKVRTSNALTKLLRPLVENGELESIESDRNQKWQCKRDELINLLRVVLKKKEHALANKHGVIHGVLSAEETSDDPHSPPSIPQDLMEILRPLPADVRTKVQRGLQAIIEKISDKDMPDLKAALKDLIYGLQKNPHQRPNNQHGIASLEEAVADLSDQGSNEGEDGDILPNLNPSQVRERVLHCLKSIIKDVTHRGIKNLSEIVHRQVRDLIKTLVKSGDDPRLLNRMKSVARKVERKIATTIRQVLEKPLQDLSEDSQEAVKNSIKELVDSIVELLAAQPVCPHAATNNSPKLPPIVEKIFNDLLNERNASGQCLGNHHSQNQDASSELDVSAESHVTMIPHSTEKSVDPDLDESLELQSPTSEAPNDSSEQPNAHHPVPLTLADVVKAVKPFRDVARDILHALKDTIDKAKKDPADEVNHLVKDSVASLCTQILFPDQHSVSHDRRVIVEPFVQHFHRKFLKCVKDILKEAGNDQSEDRGSVVESLILNLLKDLSDVFEPESESNKLPQVTRDLIKHIVSQLVNKGLTKPTDNDFAPTEHDASVILVDPPFDNTSTSVEGDMPATEIDESRPERPSLDEILKQILPVGEKIQDKCIGPLKDILQKLIKAHEGSGENFIKETLDNLVADILSPQTPTSVQDALAKKIMNGAKRIIDVYIKSDTEQVSDLVEKALVHLMNEIAENIDKPKRASFEDILQKILPEGSNLEQALLNPVKKALKELIVDDVEDVHQLLKDTIEEPIKDVIPDKARISRVTVEIGDKILITKEEIVAELQKEAAEETIIDSIRKLVKDIVKVILGPKLSIIENILQKLKPNADNDESRILDPVKEGLKKLIANGSDNIDDNINHIVRDLLKDDISSGESSSPQIEKLLKPIQREVGNKIHRCAQQITNDVLKDQTNSTEKLVKNRVKDLLKDLVDSVLPVGNQRNRHNKDYPLPEGLVPKDLSPVIHQIVDVLGDKDPKPNKDAIKQVTDDLLNKLHKHTTNKSQDEDDEDDENETSEEESLTTTTPKSHHDSDTDAPSSSISSNEDSTEQPADSKASEESADSSSETSEEHETVPPVVVSPTGTNGTYKVTLNIDQLVDKEFKKLRNLHCECREGPVVNEKCPIHSVSKDDIKKAIQRNFFRKLIKAVPIDPPPSADDVIVDGIKQFIENKDNGSDDASQPLEDHPLAKQLVQKVQQGITKILEKIENKELTEVESDNLIERAVEKVEKLNNAREDVLENIGDFLSERLDRPKNKGPRLPIFKRLSQHLVNRLKHHSTHHHRHQPRDMFHRRKRQTLDFPPVEYLPQDDDCPTCPKIERKRRDMYERYLTKEPKTMLKKAEKSSGKLNKFRRKQLRQIKFDFRSRRQATPECGRCDGKFVNLGGNSTELGETATEKISRITRENYNQHFSGSHEKVNIENADEPLRVSLNGDKAEGSV